MLNSAGFYILLLMGYAVYAILVVRLVPRNICLGAIVPEEKRDDPKCRRLQRRYDWGVVLTFIVFIVFIRLQTHLQTRLSELNLDGIRMGTLGLVYFFLLYFYFFYFRKRMLKCVREENWLPDRDDGTIVVDTTFHQKRKSISPYWLLLFPLVIVGTLVAYAIFRPEIYSGRFADTFAELGFKNIWHQSQGDIAIAACKNIMIAFQVYFAVIAAIIFYGYATARQALDPKDPNGSLEKELKRRKTLQTCLLVIYIAICMILASFPFFSSMNYMLAVFCFYTLPLYLFLLAWAFFHLAQMGSIEARKNVPGNLPATMFYNDPDDSALFIWNRSGLGVLLNWGNPRGKIITVGGIVLLPVVLLVFFCYLTPVTNFLPRYDISQSRQKDVRDGARLFANAVLESRLQKEKIGNLSVKGTIELIRLTPRNGETPVSHDDAKGDAKNAIRDFIDSKRSFESLDALFQRETVRADKVLFANVREQVTNPEHQALLDDGYLVGYEQTTHDYLREHYNGFDFSRMGQVQGKLVEAFEREVNHVGPMLIADFQTHRNWNVDTFVRDAALVSEYHGFVILSAGERLAQPTLPDNVTQLWSASMVAPNRRGYSLRNEILLCVDQNYASPKCLYQHDADKFEAFLSSDYFSPAPKTWLPTHYTAITVDANAEDGSIAQVVRVRLEAESQE